MTIIIDKVIVDLVVVVTQVITNNHWVVVMLDQILVFDQVVINMVVSTDPAIIDLAIIDLIIVVNAISSSWWPSQQKLMSLHNACPGPCPVQNISEAPFFIREK